MVSSLFSALLCNVIIDGCWICNDLASFSQLNRANLLRAGKLLLNNPKHYSTQEDSK